MRNPLRARCASLKALSSTIACNMRSRLRHEEEYLRFVTNRSYICGEHIYTYDLANYYTVTNVDYVLLRKDRVIGNESQSNFPTWNPLFPRFLLCSLGKTE